MVHYKDFSFAAAPKTGSTWFIKAAALVNLGEQFKTKLHIPPPKDWNGYLLTMVRHPYDWLCSYALSLRGGAIGVPCVDKFVSCARLHPDVHEFIEACCNLFPGQVGKMFDSYNATTVIKLEDLPWAACEFFASVGAKSSKIRQIQKITPQNVRKGRPHIVDKRLRKLVMKAEEDFCERYEYDY